MRIGTRERAGQWRDEESAGEVARGGGALLSPG